MKFDVWLPTANPFTTPELLSAIGGEAEERGVDTIWVGEHVVTFEEYASSYPYSDDGRLPLPARTGLLEPFTTLAFLAALTTRVRLGTAMCLLPQRNPVYTAKEVATLDWLSGGRVDLGVGVGWLREEFDALAVPWERRGARTDDYLGVLKSLWCDDPSSYSGEFYTLAPCHQFPKPVQVPHPPIHIGGESDAALRRTARTAQGWHSFSRPPADLAAPLTRLDALLGAEGRSRAEITVTVCPYFQELSPATVEQYAAAGADAVAALLFVTDPADVPGAFDALGPSIDRARSGSPS
ncbi:MAG TPA: LLM class F420-dependent oxidoreductase [Acidimicrobiales bacterium]|nr:LLM class F420-dependent oxidoreductase [Acidimicrobiales bacterium]